MQQYRKEEKFVYRTNYCIIDCLFSYDNWKFLLTKGFEQISRIGKGDT